jgi:hypothetical protein
MIKIQMKKKKKQGVTFVKVFIVRFTILQMEKKKEIYLLPVFTLARLS